MTRHELKCWPAYFAAVRSGAKRFELRKNDRGFALGDQLAIREWDPDTQAYTGQVEERQITFLLSEEDLGVIHGYVAIGFGPVTGHLQLDQGAVSPTLVAAWHRTEGERTLLMADNHKRAADQYAQGDAGEKSAAKYRELAALCDASAHFHLNASRMIEAMGGQVQESGDGRDD